MGNLTLTPLKLAGAAVATTRPFADERGLFARLFAAEELADALQGRTLAHINASVSTQAGTVRGLHLQQAPHAEVKFVRCLQGKAYDVLLDLRKGSATFMQWAAVELSPEALNMVIIPEGVAHGFQTLCPHTMMMYATTHPYTPAAEMGVNPFEPQAAIAWPLPPTAMAMADTQRPHLPAGFEGLVF